MIEAFTGLPGQGKTYNMVRKALKEMKRGRKVYANFSLKGANRFDELSDLVGVQNALIVLDEASIYLPSLAWKSIPLVFVAQLRQHRHDGLDLWYSSQDLRDVASALRRVTMIERKFSRISSLMFEKISFVQGSKIGFDISFLNKKVFDAYDTTENVALPKYLKNKINNNENNNVNCNYL